MPQCVLVYTTLYSQSWIRIRQNKSGSGRIRNPVQTYLELIRHGQERSHILGGNGDLSVVHEVDETHQIVVPVHLVI